MPQEISGMVFRIELIGVEKPIWRRFFVPRDISFKKFQEVISIVMGWKGWKKHRRQDGQTTCFAFSFGQEEFGLYLPEDGSYKEQFCILDNMRVEDYFRRTGSCGLYEYNFDAGGWPHVIILEDYRVVVQGDLKYLCFDGEMACPPAGSWPSAYNRLCEYKNRLAQGAEGIDILLQSEVNGHIDFDAVFVQNHLKYNIERFDCKAVNAKLQKLE